MVNRKTVISGFVLCVLLFVYLAVPTLSFAQSASPAAGAIPFKGKASKVTLLLGEPLIANFEVTNTSERAVRVIWGGVDSGSLKIYIAYGNGGYNEYFGRGWGRKRGGESMLEPGKSVSVGSAMILWNGKPNVSHLNEGAAREVLAGKITTEYAFQEPGIYFLRGCTYIGPDAAPIESEPVRIEVNQPEGIDLAVWEEIKGDRHIAVLMQNDDSDLEEPSAKAQLIAKAERIISGFPNSVYVPYLRSSLEKFKVADARRERFLRNLKP